jgi:hypothetical protein
VARCSLNPWRLIVAGVVGVSVLNMFMSVNMALISPYSPRMWSQSSRGISTSDAVVPAGANTETAMLAVETLERRCSIAMAHVAVPAGIRVGVIKLFVHGSDHNDLRGCSSSLNFTCRLVKASEAIKIKETCGSVACTVPLASLSVCYQASQNLS